MSKTTLDVAVELELPRWKVRELEAYVGGLSTPSKMPGYAYGLPAAECKVGTKLRGVPGSTCEHCYAYMRGMYSFPCVIHAQYRRLATITKPHWVEAMAELINRRADPARAAKGWKVHDHFRWHDSGDIQSREHLSRIMDVAELTPSVAHWLPTREYRIVREVLAERDCPPNLNVRMSAHMIGGQVPRFPGLPVTVSSVSKPEHAPADAHDCPARHQGNACGSCRACWSPNVRLVNYALH